MADWRTFLHPHQRRRRWLTVAVIFVVVIALAGMLALWHGESNVSVGHGGANAGGNPPAHPREAELLAGDRPRMPKPVDWCFPSRCRLGRISWVN